MSDTETLLIPTRVHGRVLVRRTASPQGILAGFHGYAEHASIMMQRLEHIPGSEGWTLLSVQGLHRFYRGRTDETVAGWMTREDRLTAIEDNIAYVDAALDAGTPGPGTPLVFTGFSQGVAMACRAAVRGRHRASAVVAVGGDVPPELLEDPAAVFPDVFLVRGETDAWYTAEKMDRDGTALASRGVRVGAEVFAGGHEWTPAVSALIGHVLAAFSKWPPPPA